MNVDKLPEIYQGFSTDELIEIWKSIPSRTYKDKPIAKDKICAMRDLLMEYEISDIAILARQMGQPHPLALRHNRI